MDVTVHYMHDAIHFIYIGEAIYDDYDDKKDGDIGW